MLLLLKISSVFTMFVLGLFTIGMMLLVENKSDYILVVLLFIITFSTLLNILYLFGLL